VVAQQPVQRGSFSLGHAGSTCIVILLHRCSGSRPFKVVADVGGRYAAHHALDAVSPLASLGGAKIATIAIVNKRGRGCPADRGHAVLSVIRVAGGAACNFLDLVSIGVVAEGGQTGVFIVECRASAVYTNTIGHMRSFRMSSTHL